MDGSGLGCSILPYLRSGVILFPVWAKGTSRTGCVVCSDLDAHCFRSGLYCSCCPFLIAFYLAIISTSLSRFLFGLRVWGFFFLMNRVSLHSWSARFSCIFFGFLADPSSHCRPIKLPLLVDQFLLDLERGLGLVVV